MAETLTPDMRAVRLLGDITSKEEQPIGRPRASSLYDACMKLHILGTLQGLKSSQNLVASQMITFGLGSAFHSFLQNDAPFFGDRRRGQWECRACDKILPFGPRPSSCQRCGAKPGALIYHESVLTHDLCTGHPDLFLESRKKDKLIITEFKTISNTGFDSLVAPDIKHVWQVSAYMMFSGSIAAVPPRVRVARFAYVQYFSKLHVGKGFPSKAFKVVLEPVIENAIREKLGLYRVGVESKGKILPGALRECLNLSWRRRSCPAKGICFGGDHE